MLIMLCTLIGVVAGLRAMTAPALVAWASFLGWLTISAGSLSWLGAGWVVAILSIFAVGELITDQLPSTPSRTVLVQFSTRLVTGGLSGAALGASSNSLIAGLAAGFVGAVIGTFGGAAARAELAARIGRDRPAAFLEDCVAILGGLCIVLAA